jgi:two-component system, NtrC family, sensor kinase
MAETARARDSMRESQALYYSLVENIPHLVVRKDLDGVYRFINGSGNLTGLSLSEESIGKTDFDIFPRPF